MSMVTKKIAKNDTPDDASFHSFFTVPAGHMYHFKILITNKGANAGTVNVKRTLGGQDYTMNSYNTALNPGPGLVIGTFPYEVGDEVSVNVTGTTADFQAFGNDETLPV